MPKIRLMIVEASCRGGLHHTGEVFIVGDCCPPICHELWHNIYPMVFALQNGAALDYGEVKAKSFNAACPDGGRVKIIGEVIEQ